MWVAAEQLKQRLAAGAELPCSVELFHRTEQEAWASGCVMIEIEIEIERATGELRIEELV